MIIYSSSLVAVIAAVAGYLAYSSFFQLEEVIQNGTTWQEELAELRSIILVTCGSIFIIALVCGQFIARFLTNSMNELYQLAHTIKMDDDELTETTSNNDNNHFDGLVHTLEQSQTIVRQKKELEILNKTLALRNDSLDSLVYRVSHDLKAPVINIKSLLAILSEKLTDHQDPILNKSLELANGATDKLKNTITDLLEVARIEKHIRQEKKWHNLADIIEAIREENHQEIIKHSVKFQIDLAAKDKIYFSKNNLTSIISNLITNSIKYHSADRPPMVIIQTIVEQDGTYFVIEDNGIGIDLKKYEAKLFKMFNRFHDHVEGSGIGLYIVKKLVKEGDGELTIESTPDVGTKIKIYFPHPVEKTDPAFQEAL